MLLKALELQGFKSFPDKTTLEFGKGITAVIGPNGSGKSNISDAVRWVLGEQSSKSLRGSKMEDVIFGGTSLRKAMGFAEVTLRLDNTDRTLNNCDKDDVSVTRRYYRSGESEYQLNGETVRLRDIHELFMDTGLGRDGDSAVNCGRLLFVGGGFRSQFFYLHGYSAARAHQLFYLSRYLFELALRLLIVRGGEGYFILLRLESLAGALYRLEPETYLKLLLFPCKHKEFLRLFALRFERSDASFELGQYIAQANEIFLRLFESACRVRAAVSEMGYSRRLFEHIAPLRRARRDKVGDSALADH